MILAQPTLLTICVRAAMFGPHRKLVEDEAVFLRGDLWAFYARYAYADG